MTRRIFCKVLLVVVAVFSLLTISGILLAQGRSEDAFERVREVQERHTDRLMAIEGVEGTAVGLDENDQPAVKVFTARPAVAGIPRTLEGVPVQVEVTGEFYALPKPEGKPGGGTKIDPTTRFLRPVPIGVSTGNALSNSAGTIGCRVKKGDVVYALSNNHVYALENTAPLDSSVLQPGVYDGGKYPEDEIGTLFAFVPIVFSEYASNTIDAAIAQSTMELLNNTTPSNGYGPPKSTTEAAYIGQPVQKYGRTTSLTKGTVTGINAIINVGYSSGTARFVGQVIVQSRKPFIKAGDSGSLLVTDPERNPVGLLFAGDASGKYGVANPIDAVLGAFGVTIDGEGE